MSRGASLIERREESPEGPEAPAPGRLPLASGYETLQRRYLRLILVGSVVINASGLLEPAAPPAMRTALLSLVLLSGLATWWLVRGGDSVAIGKALTVGFTAGALVIAWTRLPDGWPFNLNLLPMVLVMGTLIGGARLAGAVAVASVLLVSLVFLLPGVPRPPFLATQLTNWGLSVLLLQLFTQRMVAVLDRGAAELAASSEALARLQASTEALSRIVATRVSAAVEALDRVLRSDAPRFGPAATEVGRLLAEGRASIPPEPALGRPELDQQVESLRLKSSDWLLAICALLFAAQTLRNATWGPSEYLPFSLLMLGVTVGVGVARLLRPAWRPRLILLLILALLVPSSVVLWNWFARAPISPPIYAPWLMVAVVAAMTAGPHVSGLMLAVMLALSLVALQRHPGLPWTAPVVLAAGYGVAAWMLWRWPAQLLEALRARRDAAAASILVRRRLVATLFHDLANPLAVILSEAAGQARGDDDAETLALARSMTRRMQATLAAALGGRVAPRRVEAGRLCDELEALFRERLGQKRLALRVAGPRGAGLLADEALLRDSVLANLLSNALKFSPEGSTIELTVGAQAGQVSFVVEDRGPGMPPEVLAALRRGGQAPSRPGTRGEAGSGFGLMLARDYLTAMGGGLELTPRDGGGLSARIWLRAA